MQWLIKRLTLFCFKDINEHQKSEINKSTDEIRQKAITDINVVNSLQASDVNNAPWHEKVLVATNTEKHRTLYNKSENNLKNLDMSNPSTEITEAQTHHTMLAIKASVNNKTSAILTSNGVSMNSEMVQAVSSQNSSLAEHKACTNKWIDCVKANMAIEEELAKKPILSIDEIRSLKSASLVEDYANPSLEMPSYMDPED